MKIIVKKNKIIWEDKITKNENEPTFEWKDNSIAGADKENVLTHREFEERWEKEKW